MAIKIGYLAQTKFAASLSRARNANSTRNSKNKVKIYTSAIIKVGFKLAFNLINPQYKKIVIKMVRYTSIETERCNGQCHKIQSTNEERTSLPSVGAWCYQCC